MALISNFEARAHVLWASDGVIRNFTLGVETPADVWARERLLDEAFGAARFEKTVERLRAGRKPAEGLAFAAKDGASLIGTLRLWHVRAGGVPALLLGPLAVAKAFRGQGIGRALMEKALSKAVDAAHQAILLVGDAAYYKPLGFSRRHTLSLALPGPVDKARFLGLELTQGALKAASGLVAASGPVNLPARCSEIALRRAA
jgi:predicted N-acetyltransferase YhbS